MLARLNTSNGTELTSDILTPKTNKRTPPSSERLLYDEAFIAAHKQVFSERAGEVDKSDLENTKLVPLVNWALFGRIQGLVDRETQGLQPLKETRSQ